MIFNHTKLDWLLFVVAGSVSGYLTYQLIDYLKPPAIEIRTAEIIEDSAEPGDFFLIKTTYYKNYDCVGVWEFRAILPDGRVVRLDRRNAKNGLVEEAAGPLGTSPPGTTYSYTVELQVPIHATPGTMRVTELDVCTGESDIMRSPVATIEVLARSSDE